MNRLLCFPRRLCHLLLAGGLLISLSAWSQERPPSETVRVLSFSDEGVPDILYCDVEGEATELMVGTGYFPPPLPLGATLEELKLFELIEPPADAPPETEPKRKALGRIPLTPGASDWLVFLKASKDPEAKLPLVGFSVDAMIGRHKSKQIRVINLTGKKLGLTMGGEIQTIAARKTDAVFEYEPGVVKLLIAAEQQKGWNMIMQRERRWDDHFRITLVAISRVPTQDDPSEAEVRMIAEYDRRGAQRRREEEGN